MATTCDIVTLRCGQLGIHFDDLAYQLDLTPERFVTYLAAQETAPNGFWQGVALALSLDYTAMEKGQIEETGAVLSIRLNPHVELTNHDRVKLQKIIDGTYRRD